jgi:hypothetical protein
MFCCLAKQHHINEDQNNQLRCFENLKNTQKNINTDFKSTESSLASGFSASMFTSQLV